MRTLFFCEECGILAPATVKEQMAAFEEEEAKDDEDESKDEEVTAPTCENCGHEYERPIEGTFSDDAAQRLLAVSSS